MTELTITIPGPPVAWQRAGRDGSRYYTQKKSAAWKRQARLEAKVVCRKPLTGPLNVRVTAYFEIPASWPLWKQEAARNGSLRHCGKPDGDNILKAAKDALSGLVYRDDSYIVASSITKEYSDHPRVEILVFSAAGKESQITKRSQLED